MALLRGDMEHFSRVMADVNASDSDTIHELLTVAESAAWNDAAHVDGQTMVHVVTVIGDIASVGLSEDEVKSYQTPRGTVLQIDGAFERALVQWVRPRSLHRTCV